MEQEEHEQKQEAGPLYYIEQPAFTPLTGPGQTVSIKKNAGTKKRRKGSAGKNNRTMKAAEESINMEPRETEDEKEDPEDPEDPEDTDRENPEQTIRELLEYIETLPHFLHPVIACETKDQYVQGDILDTTEEEITFRDRRNFNEIAIPVKDVTRMHIVSL
ncbi:hypothetical protein [Salibacterium sp. K-3]